MWIDTHCHVQEESAPAPILVRAHAAGVTSIICIGTGVDESKRAIDLARASDRALVNRRANRGISGPPLASVFATVGLHPHDASRGTAGLAELLETTSLRLAEDRPLVVGVGECGLDYHYDHSPRTAQRAAFAKQIGLAARYNLPVVVHTRDAWEDTFAVLRAEGIPQRVVFHSFTGGPEEAARCLEIGGYLSFSGIISFKNADDIRAAAAECPLDRVFVETDSPFLTPVPHRGKQNEPMYVPLVGAAVAAAKGIPVEEVAEETAANATHFFGLDVGLGDPV